jgi:hypothetical protein
MKGWRILNEFMLVLFLFSAAAQYNDPDPIRWMLIYVLAAAACLLALLRKLPRIPAALVSLAALVWAATLAVRVIGKQHLWQAEEGREMMGLLLVALWTGLLAARSRPPRARTTAPPADRR